MGQTGGSLWLGVTTLGVTVLGVVGAMMLAPDAGTKLVIAVGLGLCAAALAVNAVFFTPSRPTAPSAGTDTAGAVVGPQPSGDTQAPSRPKTIEDGEDPAVLAAAGYHRTDYPHRWEMDGPDADAPFDEQSVVLYDENGEWLTSASVFVVLNDCAWVGGSAKYFKNRNNTDCRLETLLAFPEFRNRLSSASHLVFVGMESYFDAPKPASSDDCGHGWLTACRADRLVTRTYNEYFQDATQVRPELWELDIGHANTKSPALEWYQRRALILGVRNRRPGLSVEDAVTKLATGTNVGTIKLSDFSKAGTAVAQHVPYDAWGTGGKPDTHR